MIIYFVNNDEFNSIQFKSQTSRNSCQTLWKVYTSVYDSRRHQLLNDHQSKNMKNALALSCMAAMASAMPYPMAYPSVYYPEAAYPQEAVYPQEVVYRFPRQIQRGDDLLTAADTGYAAPGLVSAKYCWWESDQWNLKINVRGEFAKVHPNLATIHLT